MKTYLHYPMKTLVNCRDLGGMPTADGGVTRFGVLIRSELPSNLAEEDLAMFRALNVTTSIDLRSDGELETSPSDLRSCAWIDYRHISALSQKAAMGSEVKGNEAKKPGPPPNLSAFFGIDWRPVYCGMLANKPQWVFDICDTFINAPGAVHFHCATGKDRTGIFAMLLLSACGVAEDDICANYSLSEIYMRPFYINMLKRTEGGGEYQEEDLCRGFFSTSHNIMRFVMNDLKEKYGSVVNYLRECGVTDEMIRRIKDKLVEYEAP